MKRLFAKGGRPPSTSKPVSVAAAPTSSPIAPHTTGLQPKYIVPPIPHPHPYDHIALLVTTDGLLLRPHLAGNGTSASYLKLSWGKSIKVEELSGDGSDTYDWKESIVVYGIVGALELFSASYLLVISAKQDVGNLFEPTHMVYCVKDVTAIPLIEEKARICVNTLAARNLISSRPSLLLIKAMDTISSPGLDEPSLPSGPSSQSTSPRVQFSEAEPIRSKAVPPSLLLPPDSDNTFSLNTDEHELFRSPSESTSELSVSGYTTPSSVDSASPASPIAKALASRLSFWSRLSKRNSLFPPTPDEGKVDDKLKAVLGPLALGDEQATLDALMSGELKEEPEQVIESILSATAPPPASTEERHSELEEKIVRECIREFAKGGMFYAYNFDITRSLQNKQEQVAKSRKKNALLADLDALPKSSPSENHEGDKVDPLCEPNATLPLWRRVDKQYWWNEWLAKPFIDGGLHSYILPIMQGYYQVASFHVPVPSEVGGETSESSKVDYVIASRRSRDRAGLRYQRRGVDDEAHVANFVESETIMRVERDGSTNIFSYVQVRGSIPLFWNQTGPGLKPPPVLSTERTRAQNLDAMKRHFQRSISLFGPHTVVNLAEQQGKEAAVTQTYREYMADLDLEGVKYHEYDFHTETKGMKYENISKLTDAMDKTFDQQGYLWISDGTVLSQQKGVFRVNCIDCLDRTNVVQSAFARYVLNKQLSAVALLNPSGKSETDTVFNDVWANNGDAISRAYAGTSALKGDFTRTGKRDLSGLLNDGMNSLARMYTSTFSDWFCQAVVDFMLGNRTLTVFSEFLLKLQSTDPTDLIRLSKIRAEAISTSVSRCLAEGERLLAGWTVFGPAELNTKIGDKFEEKVLLLTVTALYIISYDYTLEKVKLYTRVPLGDIVGITKGAYILSPLEEASRDPMQNAGFVISWLKNNETTRMTSYSVRNSLESTCSRPPSPVPVPISAPVKETKFGGSLRIPSRSTTPTLRGSKLSNKSVVESGREENISYAAFKMLPIDPARARRRRSDTGASDGGSDYGDELMGAENCKEAVDMVVECVRKACVDAGSGEKEEFVRESEVVGLGEAQKMTSVYAKMEYGVKRLLWLGG